MKTITVENNQVIVTDVTTNERKVHHYDMYNPVNTIIVLYTGVDLFELQKAHKKDVITALYVEAGNDLGTSVANFSKMLNGACYRAYIKDNEAMHNRFGLKYFKSNGKTRRIRESSMVRLVNEKITTLNKYLADGNAHLAGFSFALGEAHQAKKALGKGLWKRLNRNSKSRNDLICKALGCHFHEDFDVAGYVGMLNRTPSTILGHHDASNTLLAFFNVENTTNVKDLINKTITHIGGPMCKICGDYLLRVTHTVRDTHRMHPAFNPNWSLARIEREHTVATRAQLAKMHSDKEFGWLKDITHLYEEDGITAELCNSAVGIAQLGKDQSHCVGSYAKYSMDARYIVYKVTDAAGTVSTLGLKHPEESDLHDQHYLRFNAIVTNEACVAFVNKITKLIKAEMLPIEFTVTDSLYGGYGRP